MSYSKGPNRKNFTVFRSAAEEADMKNAETNEDDAGHMNCTSGRIITVRGDGKPFKAIMSRENGETSEHSFGTMREAEAFVRCNTPRPPVRSRTYDRDDQNG